MKNASLVSILFAILVAVGLASTANPAMGQHHGRGSHGGGSHSGGFHGGGFHGGSHGHSFRGMGHFNRGGHAHGFGGGHGSYGGGSRRNFLSSRGFHGSGGRRGENIAGRNFEGGTYAGRASSRASAATPFGHSRRTFSSDAFRNSGSVANRQWRSFGNSGYAFFGSLRGASASVGDGQWQSFGNRGNFASTTARGWSNSWQGSASRTWDGQSDSRPASGAGWSTFSRSGAGGSDFNRMRDSRAFAEVSPSGRGSAISSGRVLSNFGTRFSHSPAGRYSLADSRFGSRSWSSDRAEFGNRRGFHEGERSFGGGELWSNGNGDEFSFFPDLLGLALGLGNFALRGFNLFGEGLNLLGSAFGSDTGYGNYGGYGGFGGSGAYGGYDVGFNVVSPPLSPYWVPTVVPYALEGGIFCPRY